MVFGGDGGRVISLSLSCRVFSLGLSVGFDVFVSFLRGFFEEVPTRVSGELKRNGVKPF